MTQRAFLLARRAELKKFFELQFGRAWRKKVEPKIGGGFCFLVDRMDRAEKLARLHGFKPKDEQRPTETLERNFSARLHALFKHLVMTPECVCYRPPIPDLLDQFFGHRQHRQKHRRKHKDEHSDVISPALVVFEEPDTRT